MDSREGKYNVKDKKSEKCVSVRMQQEQERGGELTERRHSRRIS